MKKVIKLIFSFATIKPIIKLATYSFQVITNYFNIRKKSGYEGNRQKKAKKEQEKRAKCVKKNAV